MASLCFSHCASKQPSIQRLQLIDLKNEEYRLIALCVVCAIPHRAQPMMNYAGIVTSETCFVKWHQHISSNWVNGAHWPTKEHKQTPIWFCILGTWKLAWSGLKWHCDVSLLIQTLPTLWESFILWIRWSQISRFLDSKIDRFLDFQISRFEAVSQR